MYKLDDIDTKILRVLQTDFRLPLTQLSEQLGIPHGTIRDRIRKMEEAGVIDRYATIINPAKLGFLLSGFVEVTLDQQVDIKSAVEALLKIEEVTEIHTLTGNVDVFVRIWARDVAHLRQILYDKFTNIPGMVRTNTMIMLGTHTKPLPLPGQDKDPGQNHQ